MEQHAIPQQISSYEFKLVGDMTLKQFLKAAVGIVLAFLINASHLIFFLKWPLMIICAGGGLMLAFVPFQDRPLDVWIKSFLKSIYSPTIYTYKKMPDKDWINLIMSKPKETELEDEETEAIPVKNREKVKEFIESLPSVKLSKEREEMEEQSKVEEVKSQTVKTTEQIETPRTTPEPKPQPQAENWQDKEVNLNLKTERLGATGTAVFGEIPMPDKPDIPNIMVGMVTDISGKILEGAIVEIQDENGNPSRVLKTNSLGQFKTTTPMANGKYLVITEKENYKFDRVNIELTGKIVEPIKIKAIA